jgi:GNAT superfamily N-acetyltransferase
MLSSSPLDPTRHTYDLFDSGETEIDDWLKNSAEGSDARSITRTFIWTDVDSTTVVGYYSLMAHILVRDDMPKAVAHGSPREIPVVLVARLGVDRRIQGADNGGALLADASERAVLAATNLGARFLVVDALHDKAASFYEHHGFRRIPDTLRLVQKMSSVAKSLGLGN